MKITNSDDEGPCNDSNSFSPMSSSTSEAEDEFDNSSDNEDAIINEQEMRRSVNTSIAINCFEEDLMDRLLRIMDNVVIWLKDYN